MCRTLAKNEQSRHQYIYPIRERNIIKPNKGRNKVLRPENQGTGVGYARGRCHTPKFAHTFSLFKFKSTHKAPRQILLHKGSELGFGSFKGKSLNQWLKVVP